MKNMKTVEAKDFSAIPVGRYLGVITHAEETVTKKLDDDGNPKPMIKTTIEVRDGDFAGRKVFDQFLTDGNFFGKKKLAGLGIDVDGDDIPDSQIVEQILGLEVLIDVLQEPARDGNNQLKYTLDDAGRQVVEKRNTVKAYNLPGLVGGTTQAAPAQTEAPTEKPAPAAKAAPATKTASPAATNGTAPPPWAAQAGGAPKKTAAAAKK